MKIELSPPELTEQSSIHMSGVRAHKITSQVEIRSRAKLLVEEAIKWGGGSGDKEKDVSEMEKAINKAVAHHNTEEGQLEKTLSILHEAEVNAQLAATNPLLSQAMIDHRLKQLDVSAFAIYRRVVETNNDLAQYRFDQIHSIPLGIKSRQEDQVQR